MIAVISDVLDDEFVELFLEENQNVRFSLPKIMLPGNKGIKIGSRLKFNLLELPQNRKHGTEKDDDSGGFIKNKPKGHFDE